MSRLGINIHPYFSPLIYNNYKKIANEKYKIDISAAQAFIVGPKNPKEEMSQELMSAAADFLSKNDGINLYTHGCFMDVPWSNMPGPQHFSKYLIKKELIKCNNISSAGLIVHLANKSPAEIANVVNVIFKKNNKKINADKSDKNNFDPLVCDMAEDENIPTVGGYDNETKLFLENESTANTEFNYSKPAAVASIFSSIDQPDKVGFCLDTAHIYSAGIDITTYEDVEKWVRQWEDNCGEINIFKKSNRGEHLLCHLNDQFYGFGEGRDMHSALTYGQIWKDYNASVGGHKNIDDSGLMKFLEWLRESKIDAILERRSAGAKLMVDNTEFPAGDNIEADFGTLAKFGFYIKSK